MPTNADLIVQTLADCGVPVIFGVSGGRILSVFQAVLRASGIRLITTRNEQGAAFMADSYARRTGRMACCAVTSGPGATNLLTGVAGAYADSVPMIVLTGQAETSEIGHGGIQEGSGHIRSPSISSIYRQVSKWSHQLRPSDDIAGLVARAVRTAGTGRRGPVHLDIPSDVLELETEVRPAAEPVLSTGVKDVSVKDVSVKDVSVKDVSVKDVSEVNDSTPDARDLERAVAALERASAPLIVAGSGAYSAGASALLRAVQRHAALPVVTSLGGRGLVDEFDPLSGGMIGCYGQDAANAYLLDHADVILALGVSFQYLTAISWNPIWQAKTLIHVDIDRRELGKNFEPSIALHGSLTHVLEALLQQPVPPVAAAKARRALLDRLRRTHGFFPSLRVHAAGSGRPGFVNPAQIFVELARRLSEADVVVIDSGENAYWAMYSLRVRAPRQLLSNNAWGSMGYGVAAPVGAAVAAAGAQVYGVCGDGGLMMNVQELSTAVQHGLHCTWLLMDNQGYGTQRHWQRDWYDARYIGTDMPAIDYARLAESLGLAAFEARSEVELADALDEARRHDGCSLIWIHIDPEVKPPQAIGSTLKK